MRKRLVLFFVLVSSILCMIGCGNNPYEKMSLISTNNGEAVQLNITEETVNGNSVYSYDTYTFDVQVKDVGDDIDRHVILSGGQGMIDYSVVYKGNGISTIKVTPLSHDKTGKFTLVVKTVEGNKSMSIDFNIDLKLNNFFFKDDNLQVVSKGQEIDLNDLTKYIEFNPVNTTQKDIKFEVVTPIDGVISGYSDYSYEYENLENTVYAEVKDNILKTYTGVEYPKKIESFDVGNNSQVYTQCVTLKASYVGTDAFNKDEAGNVISQKVPDRFINIEVIENCSDVQLLMNYQVNNDIAYDGDGSSFTLEKNDKGEYDVTLLNPNYRFGVQYDTYYIERDLMFNFGETTDSYNPGDYYVQTDSVLETSNKPIVLSYSSLDNSFKVQAQSSGTYKHVFKIDHVKYPGIIDTEIVVNFHVLDLPTDIKINGNVVKDSYKIYDYYDSSYGARFNIDLNNAVGDFTYFVYVDNEEVRNNLHIYKNDGIEHVLAVCRDVAGAQTIITDNHSFFKDNETFYLRHSFETLPVDEIYVNVAVKYAAYSDSYSHEIRDNYFIDDFVSFPIKLVFENGLKTLTFTQKKYMVDVTNDYLINGLEDMDGIKLFDLPKGHTVESALETNGIIYDHELIHVYSMYDELEDVTSVYMKSNSDYKVGNTTITVKTRNGLIKSTSVELFVPTIYSENLKLNEESYYMPIGMEIDEDNTLYYFTGVSEVDPHAEYVIRKTVGSQQEIWGDNSNYMSLSRLILLKNSTLEIKFYDYLLKYDANGMRVVVPIDITDKVNITFNYDNYVTYKNGKITAKNITENIDRPIIMTVTYMGAYMGTTEEGLPVYKTMQETRNIEIYVYNVLERLEIITPTNVDLYVEDFLGYFDKDLAETTIQSNFKPHRLDLGAEWNDRWATFDLPVNLFYDIDTIMDREIYDTDGRRLEIQSVDGKKSYVVKYADLFENVNSVFTENYTLTLKCRVGPELLNWLHTQSGYMIDDAEIYMRNNIFNRNIRMIVNVYAKQFSKIQLVSPVNITARLSEKISKFDIDIADDGVYFEINPNAQSELTQNIGYTIDNPKANNKNIMLINGENSTFNATVSYGTLAIGGVIKIMATGSGVEYLTAVPEDNIKGIDSNGDYIYYDNALVQTFRIKVADGSQQYPYEIKSVDDYNRMQDNVKSNSYYYYILTTNINLRETNKETLIFDDSVQKIFSLDGAYSYSRNGVEYNVTSRLYNLNIKQTINATKDVYLGLFGKITNNVILRNLTLTNVRVELKIDKMNGHVLNVGLLSGAGYGAQVYNTQVIGGIKVTNVAQETTDANINIGGWFGESRNLLIEGLPVTYQSGVSNTGYNANVSIDYASLTSPDYYQAIIENYIFNVGGLIGYDDNSSNISNVNIVPTIKGFNYNSSVGGVVGLANYTKINKVIVYPKITITDSAEVQFNLVSVGGIVGAGEKASVGTHLAINESKVYFVKEDVSTWQGKAGIYVDSSSCVCVGGLIGVSGLSSINIQYSYVKGFYKDDISSDYLGNIFVNAVGVVGGLIGDTFGQNILIKSSYFDADIVTSIYTMAGSLIGVVDTAGSKNITNTYGIANIARINSDNSISLVSGLNNGAGMIGGYIDEDLFSLNFGVPQDISGTIFGTFATFLGDSLQTASVIGLQMDNVYSIINENTYYFGEANKDDIIGLYDNSKNLVEILNTIPLLSSLSNQNIGLTFKNTTLGLGYSLVLDNATATATIEDWLWNIDVNIVDGVTFPILLNKNKTKAMYDLMPEKILLDRIYETSGLYNISYNDKVQVLMFVNKNGDLIKDDKYEIAIDNENSAISIKFNGKTIITSFIELNSDIEITEDSAGNIISLKGSYIYPVSEGIATLTISSALDKTVKLDIVFKVIAGITDVALYKSAENIFEPVVNNETSVYIDEADTFKLVNENFIDGIKYESSSGYGYIVEIMEREDDSAIININGKDYTYIVDGNNRHFINNPNLVIKGVTIGIIKLSITPCILLDDIEIDYLQEYIELSNISSVYEITSIARARSIEVVEDSLKIASNNSTQFSVVVETSNVNINTEDNIVKILKNIFIDVNSRRFEVELKDQALNILKVEDGIYYVDFGYEIDYQLIKLKLSSFTVQKTDIDANSSEYTYKLILAFSVTFNSDYYRENANSIDLNTINYSFIFKPESNENISDLINISINPSQLKEIFTNYYSQGELLTEYEGDKDYYPEENESKFIVPGRSGLLKITLDKEFSDSSYIELRLKNTYKDYITISQMAGKIEKYINQNDINYLTENITSYVPLAFNETFENESYFGIKLSKLTLNYNEKDYFNKTFFVKVDLIRDYAGLDKVEFEIISYKVTAQGVERALTKEVEYEITQLPLLDVTVDNEFRAYLGKGVKKLIDVSYSGVNNDIRYVFDNVDNNIYIVDENNYRMNGVLSIDYLNQGKQYYLCADVKTELKDIKITFYAEEIVLGVRETAKSELSICIVEFEIDSVSVDRAVNGVITLKHGQQLILTTNVKYKDIVVGNADDIRDYINEIDNRDVIDSRISLVEYAIAGTSLYKDGIPLVNGNLRLSYRTYMNAEYRYVPMNVGKIYDYVALIENGLTEGNYNFNYYMLKATSVTPDNVSVKLKLAIPYSYVNGELVIDSNNADELTEIMFEVVVHDNSTYDHPNPIETAEELITAAKSNGGDYILLNNITLKNWIPIDATFNSLDGNGYVITIESFNLTAFRGDNEANIGIFASTSENTLLKNITVDVKNLLTTETELINDINTLRNSTETSYKYKDNLDLAYTNNINFGVLVGVNNGAITNAKIINTCNTYEVNSDNKSSKPMYLHFITTQGYLDNAEVITKIGGIVGVNSETGAVTNSLIGLNISTINESNDSFVKMIELPNSKIQNNEGDTLKDVEIFPFILAGGNYLSGLVAENNGIISNSYAKGLGLYNTYPAVKNSKTAGLVATNNGTILSSFTDSVKTKANSYRAEEDNFIIESTGNIGGFVFENNSIIENSYANVYLETQSAFTGGFVFQNNENATITKSYATSVNKNSLAHGQFTGVALNGRDVLNFGTYVNCYYVVGENEIENKFEHASHINITDSNVEQKVTWSGFSFATTTNADGIWKLTEGGTPRIATTLTDTYSFRVLTDAELITENITSEDGSIQTIEYTIYNYMYEGAELGSKWNPLIIDQAKHFDEYIINSGYPIEINGKEEFVFGIRKSGNYLSGLNDVSYVRLVNNLNFAHITTATQYRNKYLYETIFAGVLDGNGMTLQNLNINTDSLGLENFGLFAQIGIDSDIMSEQTIVKNLNMGIRTYASNNSSRAGILAGTILNSNIINVKINGSSTSNTDLIVSGVNMAGGLAGLIYADAQGVISLFDITIENIRLAATHSSLGGELTDISQDTSNGLYKSFSVKTVESPTLVSRNFKSLYTIYNIDETTGKLQQVNKTELINSAGNLIRTDVSYAGAVAGVILANNYSTDIKSGIFINDYRTKPDSSTIDNVIVKNDITISTADNSGGLFGYVGEHTLIKNSHFVLNENQLIKSFNYSGGIVAENHGVIEQCTIAFEVKKQSQIDNNLVLNDRQSGNYILFDSAHNTSNYSVGIGGIAGYSANGVIIDSYSKVNVLKPTAYIAGGIIGYSEGYNYIGYTYSTGAVYGKFVTGGLVGLQIRAIEIDNDSYSHELDMRNNIALTDWNYVTDTFDYRQEITSKLYNNQKLLYQNAGLYYNFYVKMPQIGNSDIVSDISGMVDRYNLNHDNYFVGSVIGLSIANNPDEISKIYYDRDGDSIIGNTLSDDSKINTSNIISNTLGIYSEKGSLSAGNKQDSYFETKFNYKLANNESIDLFSYRIARLGDWELNKYNYIDIDNTKPNEYFDIFMFEKEYNASSVIQEYTQQIIGKYSEIDGSSNKTTLNLFRYDCSPRYNGRTQNSSSWFADTDSQTVWAMAQYLPEFNDGTYTSEKTITNSDELNKAFTSTSTGLIYNIKPEATDYAISLELNSRNAIAYYSAIRDVYNGVLKSDGVTKPTINIIVHDDGDPDTSTDNMINTVFSLLSGVQFNNLNINIKFECYNVSEKLYSNYGLLANTLQNANISNCNISLEIDSQILIGEPDVDSGIYYDSSSAGVLFGAIYNSTLTNNVFTLDITQDIILQSNCIENFGLLAGVISNSNITNNKFEINLASDKAIKLNEYSINTNIGIIAGGVSHVSYIGNTISENKFIVEDTSFNEIQNISENSFANTNIALVFGYADNTNISNIDNFEASLEYKISGATEAKRNAQNANLALLVASSTASSYDNVIIDSNSEIKADIDDYYTENINVGSIMGRDNGNSKIGSVGSVIGLSNISVVAKCYNLSVGGLVGNAYQSANAINNSYYNSEINVENIALGIKENTADGEKITKYASSSIGGLVGESSGVVGIFDSYSAGNINTTLPVENDTYKAAIGGLVGTNSGNIELSEFVSFMNFELRKFDSVDTDDAFNNINVSGIVGQNNGLFTGNNGYSYVELPNKENGVITSAITNGSVSSTTSNVFYAQEFVGNSYDKYDYKFKSFAMADLFESINDKAEIWVLHEHFGQQSIGSIEVFVPGILLYNENNVGNSGDTRFNPKELESSAGGYVYAELSSGYYVITEDIKTQKFSIGTNKGIISGRTTKNGKVVINTNAESNSTNTSFAIGINNGTISNVYLETTLSNDKQGLNVALVNENNGLITNVYTYGYTQNVYSLANTNNAEIYQSASATVYFFAGGNSAENEIYGLVRTNNKTGIVSDCYSSNFGITKKADVKTKVYALAGDNYGVINNSMYYIPELVQYDNDIKATCETNTGTVYNCSNNMKPSFINTRRSVWSTENDHAQILGIQDIPGSIVIRVKLVNASNENQYILDDVIKIKSEIKDNATNWYFDYELDFYVKRNAMPSYNVVKIETASELTNYINSLPNGKISNKTIVMIDSVEPLNMSHRLNTFSIESSSMLIGVGKDGATITYSNANNIPYELINYNAGVLAGITFDGFKFYNENSTLAGFAPILTNKGIIYNVILTNLFVNGGNSSKRVSGFVLDNNINGYISLCKIDVFTLHSDGYINNICSKNSGTIVNSQSMNGVNISGSSSYPSGVDNSII